MKVKAGVGQQTCRLTFGKVYVVEDDGRGKVTIEFPGPELRALEPPWFDRMREVLYDGGIDPRDADRLIENLLDDNQKTVLVRALVESM